VTAAHARRWRVPSRLAHLALIASVLIGLAAMHGASSMVMSGGGHGPVSLPVATEELEAHPNADGAHGFVAHQLGELAGEAIATLSASDMGSHHSLMVGCTLALTGILTLALLWLVRCASQRLVLRLGMSRAGPRLPDRLQRAGPGLVPRFSLCVLRT
jgi:hypothetical protein